MIELLKLHMSFIAKMFVDQQWEQKMLKAADSSRSCLHFCSQEMSSVGLSVYFCHLPVLSADWFPVLTRAFLL